MVESTKSKQTKKYKSQESSDSEEFEDLEDDDDDVNHGDDSTTKNGSKQITSRPSSIGQASEGTPSMKSSRPNRLSSIVEREVVGDSQEYVEEPYRQFASKKSKPSVL